LYDLSCGIVHWNVPELLAECVASLLREVETLRARGLRVEVRILDSLSRPEVRERVARETPPGIEWIWSDENLGYPRAANALYAAADAPLVLVSNPDIVYLPGSLSALLAAIADGTVAVAGPATWWDRECRLRINPGFPEDPERIEADHRAARYGRWAEHALDWQRRMVAAAYAERPTDVPLLPGHVILVRKTLIDAVGGLFDPGTFLYYDDTDLCERLRANRGANQGGGRVLYVPQSEVVHLFNQSRRDDVPEHMAYAQRHYLTKHFGADEAARLIGLLAAAQPAADAFAAWNVVDLGPAERPASFRWQAPSDGGASVFALGINPQIVPAALAVLGEPCFALAERFWGQLTPGPYYARATDAAGERVLGYWRFDRR
jgi:GT2 family glycosyltransferase